jgi:anthranilate synthase component 2
MFLLIDNYDSFTYNLYHYLGELGAQLVVKRNDALTAAEAVAMSPQGIILSPGPCTPNEAGICLKLIEAVAGKVPLLGVCLGHQALGQAFGGKVVRAPAPLHGKLSQVSHRGIGVFQDIPTPFTGTRYHSLIVDRATLPDCLEITAETSDGLIMGMQHRQYPLHGVQFHPESIASEHGHLMLKNFLDIAASWNESTGRRSAAPTIPAKQHRHELRT